MHVIERRACGNTRSCQTTRGEHGTCRRHIIGDDEVNFLLGYRRRAGPTSRSARS